MGNRPISTLPHAFPNHASLKMHGIKPDFTLSHAYPNSTESMQETGDEAGSFQTQAVHERI